MTPAGITMSAGLNVLLLLSKLLFLLKNEISGIWSPTITDKNAIDWIVFPKPISGHSKVSTREGVKIRGKETQEQKKSTRGKK